MIMREIILLILFVFLYSPSISFSGDNFYLKGSELYKICDIENDHDKSSCHAFLSGFLDGRVTYMGEQARTEGKSSALGICFPKRNDNISDLQKSLIEEIDSNRSLYDSARAGFAVISTIKNRFPCATK